MATLQRLFFGKSDTSSRTSEGYRPVAGRKASTNPYIPETSSTTSLPIQPETSRPPAAVENAGAVSDIHRSTRPNHRPQTNQEPVSDSTGGESPLPAPSRNGNGRGAAIATSYPVSSGMTTATTQISPFEVSATAHERGLGSCSYSNQEHQSTTTTVQHPRSTFMPVLTAERPPSNLQGRSMDAFHAKTQNTQRSAANSAAPIQVSNTAKDISRGYDTFLPANKVQTLPSATTSATQSAVTNLLPSSKSETFTRYGTPRADNLPTMVQNVSGTTGRFQPVNEEVAGHRSQKLSHAVCVSSSSTSEPSKAREPQITTKEGQIPNIHIHNHKHDPIVAMSGSTATRKQALATPQVNKHSTSEHPKAREPPITIEEGQVSNPPINNSDNYNHDHTQDAVVAVAGSGTTRKQALATSQAKKHSTGQPKAREPLITIEEGQISNSAIDNSDNYEPTQDAAIEEVGSGTTGKQELPTSQTNKQPLEVVEVDQLDSEDVIIAIMGPTGAGKSSFVSKATGIIDESVGHMLTSHTSEIRATKCVVGGSNVVLVDTPGFDDTKKSDLEILQSISDWLTKTYKKEALLSGLLYFHRITDNRMAGTPLKNLRVFQKLCGNKAMSQIVLTTTMWDEVDEEVGIERLTELQGNYWKGMIARGSTTFRYWNTPESARTLLWQLVDRKRREVRLQKEIGDKDMELAETDAAQELQSRLDQAAATQRQVLERIRAQLARTTDPTTTADLWKQYEDMKAQLDETMRQTQALNLSSVKRTVAFIRRKIGL